MTINATNFETFLSAPTETGCRLWAKGTDRGYGRFTLPAAHGGKLVYAHRFAYALAYGDIPAGMDVLHRCDTPACCNPSHLFLGTQGDNNRDMWEKGRARPWGGKPKRGSLSGRSKLHESDIYVMLDLLQAGWNQSQVAREFGIDRSSVSFIRAGKTWRHIPR